MKREKTLFKESVDLIFLSNTSLLSPKTAEKGIVYELKFFLLRCYAQNLFKVELASKSNMLD